MEDGRMEEDDFVALTKQHNLPCSQLEFPYVDSKDPKNICFALREVPCSYGKAHLITVDMASKKLADVTPYTFGGFEYCEGEGDIDKFTTSCNLYYMEPFLPCEFSKYLDLDRPDARGIEDKGDHMDEQAGEVSCGLRS